MTLIPLIRTFSKKKIQGGALYISIIISILIGVLLTLFILLSNYNQRTVTVYSQGSQLYQNIKNAFEIARSDYFTQDKNGKWFKNEINDDSIKIRKLSWGAYLLITAETKNRHKLLSKCGIYGTNLGSDTALVISDNSRPVGVSGEIIIKGDCYLPKPGIKPASIEGLSYSNTPSNNVFIKVSEASIPVVDESFAKSVEEQTKILVLDSMGNLNSQMNQPFTQKTVVLEMHNSVLSDLKLKNNIKIVGKQLVIDSTCKLNNVLIICDKIRFKEGFKGSIHVIASDSILVEKKCEFVFPSSFVLNNNSISNSLKSIVLSEDCVFSGGIVALKSKAGSKVFVKLNSKSEIRGLVYSADYLHLEGKIYGTAISNSLLLKTPSAVYENHMLGCELDPKKFGNFIGIPMLFKKPNALINCKTL